MSGTKTIPPIHEIYAPKKDQVCYDPEFKDSDLAELWGIFSDCYKSKNGIRPRGGFFAAMTVQEVWDMLHNGSLDEDIEPGDPEIGHYDYLNESGQLKSFDIQ